MSASGSPFDAIVRALRKEYARHKAPVIDLLAAQTRDPLKVLVATLLSARTKDATTAQAIGRLFARAGTLEELRALPEDEIASLIFPVGFYRVKARHVKALAERLALDFGGEVPRTLEGLCSLPGVGRKTANLVLAQAFGIPAICVDVHVHRISNRLGLVETSSPFETEMALRERLPERYWIEWNTLLVSFGQTRCRPVNPRCEGCPFGGRCPASNAPRAPR
ncbi:MAG: endonuclease III domain-containing protein [Kiritimatiellia bacterium]|jgi:endonuclease III